MICLRNILLPVDYSERCLAVTRQAIGVAECFGSEITALHVLASASNLGEPFLNFTDKGLAARRRKAELRLGRFIESQAQHVPIRAILREGNPAVEILSQVAEDNSDLLMMPTHGFSAFRVLLLGSVTARCLYEANCPVWAGPHTPPISGIESP